MNADTLELLAAFLPEAVLVAGGLALLAVRMARRSQPESTVHGFQTTVAVVSTLAALVAVLLIGARGVLYHGHVILDTLAVSSRAAILVLGALSLIATHGSGPRESGAEHRCITLFATAGLLLMSSSQNLLLLFAALELASLSLYILAGFDRSRSKATEAALKYFLFGAVAAAVLLFGLSLIWGLTHSLQLDQISGSLFRFGGVPLLNLALAMIVVAVGFKTASAPFHLWAPDVYEGSPLPAVSLIASGSKVAAGALFVRLLWPGLGLASGSLTHWSLHGWAPLLALLSLASLLIGNLGALAQTNLRRLIAYSAIAHAGNLVLAVLVAGPSNPATLFYYAATYGLATVGILGVASVLETSGAGASLSGLGGLYKRSPVLAAVLGVFVLSLAGIPPLAGFVGKFSVFAQALRLGGPASPLGALAIVAIAMSAVALYYYLRILKAAWVQDPEADAPSVKVSGLTLATLASIALSLFVLGAFPNLLLSLF